MATKRGKRGPYKRYLHDPSLAIPRQTLSNWRQKGLSSLQDNEQAMETELTDGTEQESSELSEVKSEAECVSPAPDSSRPPTPPAPPSTTSHANIEPACIHLPVRLYPGAQISEATGKLLLHSLAVKHGLTQAAQADILKVLRLHMPADSIPPSYRSVHRLYHASTSSVKSTAQVVHTICSDCGEIISETSDIHGGDECMHFNLVKFYEVPLDAQIQALFKGLKII